MARKKPLASAKQLSDSAGDLAVATAMALVVAERLQVKFEPVENFSLKEGERATVACLASLTPRLRKKLSKNDTDFTVAETASMVMAIAESILDAAPKQQVSLMLAAETLMECLQANLVPRNSIAKEVVKNTAALFQFKITLIDIRPAIWRRIQVPDCSLAELHLFIQTAFGWQNCHMHQFEIEKKRYSTPMPDGYADDVLQFQDETKVTLSNLLPPKSRKKIRWLYEYDFGDGWRHEVLFEGNPPLDPKLKAPICLEGERACPPEDCGGPWGYDDFLAAITNRKHPRHEEIVEWIGEFDPEAFDAKAATKEMRKTR